MNKKLPSLHGGNGLPGRQIALCDGRTTMRISQEPEGFDLLKHAAYDSWFPMSTFLQDRENGKAMTLVIDGKPHRFEWTEVYPFGYENREGTGADALVSRCALEEGAVVWEFENVAKFAELVLPKSMFLKYDSRDNAGRALEVSDWSFNAKSAEGKKNIWTACRKEEWLFRDSSTYAGIAGKKIESEPHSSQLHVAVGGSGFSVNDGKDEIRFKVVPQKGRAFLVMAMDPSADSAAARMKEIFAAPELVFKRQLQRHAKIAGEIPELEFGKHTAMKKFFSLAPSYLEYMRIKGETGAYRANNDYYWVWSWDMTRPAFGILSSNRHEFVRKLLDFNDKTSYVNQYDSTLKRDLRSGGATGDSGLPGALDYMLAHDYLAWTGDVAGTRKWKKNFVMGLQREVANPDPTGMWTGAAASTDFPEEFGRTFPAWLAYSMSWHYAGLLSGEKMLYAWGENKLAEAVRAQALKVRDNFKRVFWNDKTGFWNEGVHATNPDLVCDIPLSTATAAMDSPYGEDLYSEKLVATANFCAREFLREDGVHITARNEVRGWKEWTRQPNNWFAANDTMLVRLFRTVGNSEALEKLFYLYEINFGYQPAAFEGKPFRRPLNTSGSWQAFGAGSWYRNLVEGAAGLWADIGGIAVMPCGLGEPITIKGIRFRDSTIDFSAKGQGTWPRKFLLDGSPVSGSMKLPLSEKGHHKIEIEYGPEQPSHPILILAVDAKVGGVKVSSKSLSFTLDGKGYTPISFFSPSKPAISAGGKEISCEWDELTGRGRTRLVLDGKMNLVIAG